MSGFKYVEDPILGKGRAEFNVGGGTGGTSYVAGDGITIAGNTISATGSGGVTEAEFKNLSDGTQSISKDVTEARHIPNLSGTPLTLLHFSDIHADSAALGRIMVDKAALGTLVDDVLCTGDIVGDTGTSISSWWNSSVLTCIGNHDTATYSADTGYDWTAVSMAQRDAWYIEPYESNWNITHTSGTSYYYKDYSTQKVRLIVMDVMLYMSDTTSTEAAAQTSWLSSLLADAITNSLHVIIAIHPPHGGAVPVKCSFTRFGQGTMPTRTDCNTPDTVVNTVASAITSGLHFVGYLVGHTHQDNVWDATGDGTQLMYCVTCAAVSWQGQWQNSDMTRSASLDAYNIVTIDTTKSRIKIVRGGGANIDDRMRKREALSVDYSTGKVIDYEITDYATSAGTAASATSAILATSAGTAYGIASSAVDFGLAVDGGTASLARFRQVETVTGNSVTLQAGHSYKVDTTSAVTLNAEIIPTGYYGLDGHIDIFTTSASYIVAGQRVVIKDTITPNAWNYCVVRFANGLAKIYVSDTEASTVYVVVQNADLTYGSLYFGLTDSSVTANTVNFDVSLDGSTISLGGATVTSQKHVVGNGITSTTLTGSVGVGGGGYLDIASCTLANVYVSSGATVVVGSGGLAINSVTGAGSESVINLGGNTVVGNGSFSNVTLSGGTLASGSLEATGGAVVSLDMSSGTSLAFSGSNTVGLISGTTAGVIVSSGAILNLTGNTNAIPINPGGGVIVDGGCQVITSSGTTATIAGLPQSRAYGYIGNDGTLQMISNANIAFENVYENVKFTFSTAGRFYFGYGTNVTFRNVTFDTRTPAGGSTTGSATIIVGGTITWLNNALIAFSGNGVKIDVTIEDNTTLDTTGKNPAAGVIDCNNNLVIGSGVKIVNGGTTYNITGGTYTNSYIDKNGNIVSH